MPENYTPPQDAPQPGAGNRPSQEERILAMVAHIAGVASSLIVPIVVSLVIYLVKKDESQFVGDAAKEALNFQITVALAAAVSGALFLCGIGFLIWAIVGVASFIFALVAGIKVFDGESYRYPYTLRFL